MWDDDWDDDEDDEQLEHDVMVRTALRFQGWRRRQRARAAELAATVRDDDLDIDWSDFATTRGAFTGGVHFGFIEPLPVDYEIDVLTGPEALVASGGLCAPSGHYAEVRWDPWGRYIPLIPPFRLIDVLAPITAPRGGIRFLAPPAVVVPCDT